MEATALAAQCGDATGNARLRLHGAVRDGCGMLKVPTRNRRENVFHGNFHLLCRPPGVN
jgi:NAD(P)H-hydrate repair Nnr-like enzyme with NAD(P)H-hydrate dehydratase domain